jgi:hypothetical protein
VVSLAKEGVFSLKEITLDRIKVEATALSRFLKLSRSCRRQTERTPPGDRKAFFA